MLRFMFLAKVKAEEGMCFADSAGALTLHEGFWEVSKGQSHLIDNSSSVWF